MRRAAALAAATLAFLTAGALFAGARAEDLEDYLERSAESEFSGRQLVACRLGKQSAADIYRVVRSGGMTVLHRGGHDAMVGDGKIGDTAGFSSFRLADWSAWRLSSRYQLSGPRHTGFMGREVTEVRVMEGDRLRTRLILDTQSWAPLFSEVYDGAGRVYCLSAMLEFGPAGSFPVVPGPPDGYEMIPSLDSVALPDAAAGYWRADSYRAPEGMTQSFYTDGLFSFSVFEASGSRRAADLEDGWRHQVGGAEYLRTLLPGEVRVLWRADGRTYLLVGDLPPDHLDQVLQELPRPRSPSLLSRLWQRLFG